MKQVGKEKESFTLKRTSSLDTLPASDIDENAVSLYNSGYTSSQTSFDYLSKSSSTLTKAQESYKARIALDFACPTLKRKDSGLGCSLSGIDMPGSQESLTVTSSQESTSSVWKASDSAYSSLENLREKIVRSPETVSLMVPKSTSVLRVISPLKSPIKILHHHSSSQSTISSSLNIHSQSPLKGPEQILQKISPIQQLLSPIDSIKNNQVCQKEQPEKLQDLCTVCMVKPKEASIIHGKTGHQVCCYVCAKRLKRKGKPCPVCRRPIQRVIKNYLV